MKAGPITSWAAALLTSFSALEGGAAAKSSEQGTEQVALIANEIIYDEAAGTVTATGDVAVFFDERTLTADSVTYDATTGRVSADGAITLRSENGETLFADTADLDPDLQDGLIRGARGVIADGGKIAAIEAQRSEGRYTTLEKAVFSPCEVCANRPVPLWRIRAERIVHDQEKREIHYENAYFDVFGQPIGYLPYFRHPSPEVERASGFLAPEGGHDRAYGAYVKLPYYWVINEHSDATITPFLSSDDGVILETEYRRRFENGFIDLNLNFGVSDYDSDNRGARPRLGGFGTGRLLLDEGVHAGIDLAFAADDPFLRRYDYTDDDRLLSQGFVRAYDGPNHATGTIVFLQSLRDNEAQGSIPVALPEVSLRHVVTPAGIGGELGVTLDAVGLVREDGRDVARASLGADWSREVVTKSGIAVRGFAEARADFYSIGDDAALDGEAARFSPRAGVEARMPFIRSDGDATHIIEPIAQLTAAPELRDGDIPNEDSVLVEFDEMNLFETDRFTGFDRRETGIYATLGLRYEYFDASGIALRAAGGRVLRLTENNDFSQASGLDGSLSDYVVGASAQMGDGFSFSTRWQLSDNFGINRAEVGGRYDGDPLSLYGYFLYTDADPSEGSLTDRSEISLGASMRLDRNWTLSADARRDLIAGRFVTAGGALSYEDECAGLDIYARRRFTQSAGSPDGTSFGVRVRLFGAGSSEQKRASGTCAFGAE